MSYAKYWFYLNHFVTIFCSFLKKCSSEILLNLIFFVCGLKLLQTTVICVVAIAVGDTKHDLSRA